MLTMSTNLDSLPVGRIVSLQVGLPRAVPLKGRMWESAIVKTPVEGKVALGKENLSGDYQANRKYHGGPDKAICAYASEWFPFWKSEFDLDLSGGAFGENLTLEGLPESSLCVGDTLTVGDVLLQISQPRQPCANVSKRWSVSALPRRMEETGYTGFYCRVLQKGELAAGQIVQVTERPHPGWLLSRANEVMYAHEPDAAAITALRELPLLSAEWKRILGRKGNRDD